MSRYDYGYGFYHYEPTVTKKVKGGIKSQSKRVGFCQSWWAKRWIGVLEGFNIGARLSRGKSYARKGQVVSIDIERGQVLAKVQGSRSTPYKVKIAIEALSQDEWKKLACVLSSQAIFAAKLLGGEMPEDIEKAFFEAKLSLFPVKSDDLETECSCPDWSNPCKHIAAVYYLLGEEFDRDPFLIFKLRGLERDELVNLLGGGCADDDVKTCEKPEEIECADPLPVKPEDFWGHELKDINFLPAVIPDVPALLVKRLGKFPLWRGNTDFMETMEDIYRHASRIGLRVFAGDLGGDTLD